MAHIAVNDFRLGIDRRRRRVSGAPGSLWDLVNCHITRGGDIERRKALVPFFSLPAGTFGLADVSGQLFVFGGLAPPAGIPGGIEYQRLEHPTDGTIQISRILDVDAFDAKLYVVAEFEDGSIFHYSDGARVTSWDGIAEDVASNEAVAEALALKLDLAAGVSAVAAGTEVVITADEVDAPFTVTASAENGGAVDDQELSVSLEQASSATLPQVSRVAVGGTFETGDTFTVTLNGADYFVKGSAAGIGTSILTFQQKLYSTVSTLLYFSGLNTPTNFVDALGSGFINLGNESGGNETLNASAEFQGNLAIFSRQSVRIWSVDPDPALNRPITTVRNSGTQAPRSVVPYGNIDVFYLSDSGIRSLRPRGLNDAVNVEDVGTQIDPIVIAQLATEDEATVARAVASFEPVDGRYWLAIGSKVYVYSNYRSGKITAWSVYDFGFVVDELLQFNNRLYVRSGDTVYLYGGVTGQQEPADGEVTATVELPFLSGDNAAAFKMFSGFDMAGEGVWDVKLLPNPNDESEEVNVGLIPEITYPLGEHSAEFESTHFAVKLTCDSAGAASVTNMAIHYDSPHESR